MLKIVVLALCATLSYAKPSNEVVRPCRLNDYKCIQDNIAANSACNRNVAGWIPNEYRVPQLAFETPHFNASYIDYDLIYRNHDKCSVSEYFVNRESDTSVLSIDCPDLGMESNRQLIQHYSKLEDTTYSYRYKGVYPLVRFTINMKHSDRIDICNSYVFSDVTTLPVYDITPNDDSTANFLSRDLSALYIYEREAFFYRGPHFMKIFINKLICDFNCN